MKHYIEINEQYRKVFAVEADSEEDAISRVEAAYDIAEEKLKEYRKRNEDTEDGPDNV